MKKYFDIGERLKKLRGNLSQREFAKKIGLPHKTYQRYEYGEGIPKAQALYKIAEKESVSVDWLYTGKLRGLEQKILNKEMGIPFSVQTVDREEIRNVDSLHKKGIFVPPDIDNFIDSKIYQALMVAFWESPDIYEFINNFFYLKKQGKLQEFSEAIEQIGRIFFEGDKTKLEAVRGFLKALDPGEKKQDLDAQPGTESEDNNL